VMRAGSARRRAHTAVGVATGAAALVVTGSLVTDASGAHPALASKGILEGASTSSTPQPKQTTPPPPDPLTPQALLAVQQVSDAIPGTWAEGTTSTNTAGDGLVFPCQGSRYADMRGIGTLVRTFTGTGPKKGPLTAGQSAEASADADAAEQTYHTMVGWYAGCTSPRMQLLSTHRVGGVGDEATLMVLRSWADPVTTQVVGVARTGGLTTTVVNTLTGMTDPRKEPDLAPSAGLLAAAVTGLCTLPDAGSCTAAPQLKDSPVLPVGRHPSLLLEADLPPVPTIDQPWVGTDPARAKQNPAATRCDNTEFTGRDFSKALTRTFVIPDARQLPPEFGLSETVGALPRQKATQFVEGLRSELDKCAGNDLGTDVERLVEEAGGSRDLSVWRLTVEVSQDQSVRFLMAVIRSGNAVGQLTFVPADDVSIGPGAFITLAHRAQERLQALSRAG
jgi:hypothetical protein